MSERVPRYLTIACPCCGHPTRQINGRYLRARREAAGLDQRRFARQLGFTGPYVSDIERNRRACPVEILEA